MKKLGESRSYRDEHGEFLCDGLKLLEEAVKSGTVIRTVITASEVPFALPPDTCIYRAGRGLIDSLSPLKSAQDTLFSCEMPKHPEPAVISGTHILLDGVQDPGNVGTIIRTANAFGIRGVFLTGGCADPYNPKTLRASMGAIFRQKLFFVSDADLAAVLRKNSGSLHCGDPQNPAKAFRVVGAVPHADCTLVSAADLTDTVIAIGSEGQGLSREVLALCDETITIPIAPECQSLNAATAAAIIIWEAARQAQAAL